VEKQQKLPVSPNCDRSTTDQSQLTLNFIDFIVAPIFVALRNMLPKVHYVVELLSHNRVQWNKMCEKVVEDSKVSDAQKTDERNRWQRRAQTFASLTTAKTGDVEAAIIVRGSLAGDPRRASIATFAQQGMTVLVAGGSVPKPVPKPAANGAAPHKPLPTLPPAAKKQLPPPPTAAAAGSAAAAAAAPKTPK